jgi:RNA polymerase sigma-70 factor, ECF subfamily
MASFAEGGSSGAITCLLGRFAAGETAAETELLSQVYAELRRIAARRMRSERCNHTLQPTALVNEAYLRLVDQPRTSWQDRAHFFAIAARLMRQILVDHARTRLLDKRGGEFRQVRSTHGTTTGITLDGLLAGTVSPTIDIVTIHHLLLRLSAFDSRQSEVVELHFFGGLSFDENAAVMHLSRRTVKRDWSVARAWLHIQLTANP